METCAFLFLIFISVASLSNVSSSSTDSSEESDEVKHQIVGVEHRSIEVPLDHFNLFDNRTWDMRYIVSNHSFTDGNPIFVEIGGEWTISESSVNTGPMNHLAKQHNGMLIATEHRYYGRSLPFSKDFSTKNLKYLNVEQALEDLAYLVERFKSTVAGTKHSKVVVHGCSYAGMLATWFRLRFPHIADIGYASSAPIGIELSFPEYYAAIHDVYANVSLSCINTIRKGFNITQGLLRSRNGRRKVKNALKDWACSDVESMSAKTIIYTMRNILNVQTDRLQYEEITCLVLRMNSPEMDEFERLTRLVVTKSKDSGMCRAFGKTEEAQRQAIGWMYQVCTELGFFQTHNRENSRHPFAMEVTLDEAIDNCALLFGEGITRETIEEGVRRTHRRYGNQSPKITKLLSVVGKNDPWKPRTKIDENDQEAPVIVLEGSHCVDVYDREESEELKQEQRKIRNIISNWLRQIS